MSIELQSHVHTCTHELNVTVTVTVTVSYYILMRFPFTKYDQRYSVSDWCCCYPPLGSLLYPPKLLKTLARFDVLM